MAMNVTDANGKKWTVSYDENGVETGRVPAGQTSASPVLSIKDGPMRGRSTKTGAGKWLGQGADPLLALRAASPKNYFMNKNSSTNRDKYTQRGDPSQQNNLWTRTDDLNRFEERADRQAMATSGSLSTHRGQLDPYEGGQITEWMAQRAIPNNPVTIRDYAPKHSTQYFDNYMKQNAAQRNEYADGLYQDRWGEEQARLDEMNQRLEAGEDNELAYEDTEYGRNAMNTAEQTIANNPDGLSWSPGWGEKQSWERRKREYGRPQSHKFSPDQKYGRMLQARNAYDWEQKTGNKASSDHVYNYTDEQLAAAKAESDAFSDASYGGWEQFFKQDPRALKQLGIDAEALKSKITSEQEAYRKELGDAWATEHADEIAQSVMEAEGADSQARQDEFNAYQNDNVAGLSKGGQSEYEKMLASFKSTISSDDSNANVTVGDQTGSGDDRLTEKEKENATQKTLLEQQKAGNIDRINSELRTAQEKNSKEFNTAMQNRLDQLKINGQLNTDAHGNYTAATQQLIDKIKGTFTDRLNESNAGLQSRADGLIRDAEEDYYTKEVAMNDKMSDFKDKLSEAQQAKLDAAEERKLTFQEKLYFEQLKAQGSDDVTAAQQSAMMTNLSKMAPNMLRSMAPYIIYNATGKMPDATTIDMLVAARQSDIDAAFKLAQSGKSSGGGGAGKSTFNTQLTDYGRQYAYAHPEQMEDWIKKGKNSTQLANHGGEWQQGSAQSYAEPEEEEGWSFFKAMGNIFGGGDEEEEGGDDFYSPDDPMYDAAGMEMLADDIYSS